MKLMMLAMCLSSMSMLCGAIKDPALLAERIFGDAGLRAHNDVRLKIQSLFSTILRTTPSEQAEALSCVYTYLVEKKKTLEHAQSALQSNSTDNGQALFFNLFVVTHQIQYYKNVLETARTPSLVDRMRKGMLQIFENVSLTAKKKVECHNNRLATAIIDYLEFEYTYILQNYDRLQHYFAILRKVKLPTVVRFWDDASSQYRLTQRAKSLQMPVSVQLQFVASALETVGSGLTSIVKESGPLALQSLIMGGGSMYNQWVNQEAQEKFKKLQAEQKKLSSDFTLFANRLQDQRKKIVKSLVQNFIDAQKNINTQSQALVQREQSEYLYLMQSISLDLPQRNYVIDPVSLDQLFQASQMMTPTGSSPWYNIFQAGSGDWEFDEQTNSFWQRQLVPFGTPYWAPFNGTDNPNYNSIFTEYITPTLPLTVSIECQLIACTYPFFMGIMVNRARWISGDPERLTQARLIGFYGTVSKPDDNSTRRIDVCCAEQKINVTDKKIITPLEQVSGTPTTRLFQLPQTLVEALDKNSMAFRFDLIVDSEKISYVIFQQDNNKLFQPITRGDVNNLEQYLAIFNGIGFMAAGCQASFKIIEPSALRYNDQELKSFAEMIQTTMKNYKKQD